MIRSGEKSLTCKSIATKCTANYNGRKYLQYIFLDRLAVEAVVALYFIVKERHIQPRRFFRVLL